MTMGHRHWGIKVKRNGTIHYWLTRTLVRSANRNYVERSRLVWGATNSPSIFKLTPLGILHGLTGFTLYTKEDSE